MALHEGWGWEVLGKGTVKGDQVSGEGGYQRKDLPEEVELGLTFQEKATS